MENIDKIESGSITVLNNYFQDLRKGNIFINNKEYRTPSQGMILLVAREEIKWSPAESSRPVFFRIDDITDAKRNQMKIENQIKSIFSGLAPSF